VECPTRSHDCGKPTTAREKVLVYGDYDVDGTTSVVVLKDRHRVWRGGVAVFHVPDRVQRGLRMRAEVVERASVEASRSSSA